MGRNYYDGHYRKPHVDIKPSRGRIAVILDKNIAFSAVFHTVLGIIGWPIEFFTLSEEDRVKAGIDLVDEVREIELADRKDTIDEKIQIH